MYGVCARVEYVCVRVEKVRECVGVGVCGFEGGFRVCGFGLGEEVCECRMFFREELR